MYNKKKIVPYNPELKDLARKLRKNMNNVIRVIGDWIVKNKPTPGPSQEGGQVKSIIS